MVWIEESDELAPVFAFAAIGLAATRLGNPLRLAPVGSAGVAAWSLADGALGAIVSAEPAPEIIVGHNDVGTVRVVLVGGTVGVV